MGFFDWLTKPKDTAKTKTGATVECAEMLAAMEEWAIREMSLQVCINMIANAIGRCEFRTFANGEEVRDFEYYMLNVEPNVNENSTVFWHKAISQLYRRNECLILSTKTRDGRECLVVADGWTDGEHYPNKMNEYSSVQVGDLLYRKTFKENEVLHLKLNNKNAVNTLNALTASYQKMLDSAKRFYLRQNGQKYKVHVDSMAQASEEFEKKFAEIMERQIKPFMGAENAVLPEFDGYKWERFGLESPGGASDEVRKLAEDIFNSTAKALLVPAVLVNGTVEGTTDANQRFLTYVIDPLCDQIQEENNRKRYGFEAWRNGSYMRVDSSSILHFDLFANAANVEKLIGSGMCSINDVLRAANQDPIDEDWANQHYMTLNISNIRELKGGEQVEQQANVGD